MTKIDLLITAPVEPALTSALEERFNVHKLWLHADKAAFLGENATAIRAVVTRSMIGADRPLITALPKLEIISVFGVGLDAVDLDAAKEQSVSVKNTPDVLTADTADYGMAMLLALARKIVAGDQFVRAGKWAQGLLPNSTRVGGKTLGIVGLGRIGQQVARRAEAFGMQILYTGPKENPSVAWGYVPTLRDLAETADFLILTCPGGPETRGIVDAEILSALGNHGMLINISRASVVDEPALINALREGTIAGAALDVFDNEPNISDAFFTLQNVILEPHIASTTVETRRDIGDRVLSNLLEHFRMP